MCVQYTITQNTQPMHMVETSTYDEVRIYGSRLLILVNHINIEFCCLVPFHVQFS